MTGESSQRLRDVATVSLKLGVISFGGHAAHIAVMREEVVRWGLFKSAVKDVLLGSIGLAAPALYLFGFSPIFVLFGVGGIALLARQAPRWWRTAGKALVLVALGAPSLATRPPECQPSPAFKRRIIFVDVSARGRSLESPVDDFGIAVTRRPMFLIDVHLHTGEILAVRDTPPGSGWGTVPTPVF